jgi:hypothetical protein
MSVVSGSSRWVVGTIATRDMVLVHIRFPIMYIDGWASGIFHTVRLLDSDKG